LYEKAKATSLKIAIVKGKRKEGNFETIFEHPTDTSVALRQNETTQKHYYSRDNGKFST
jgi:hypothetical protein